MPTLKIIGLSTLWLEIFHCVPFKLQKQMSASKEKCKHVTIFHFKTSLDHQVQPRSGGGWGWHGTQPLTTAQGTRQGRETPVTPPPHPDSGELRPGGGLSDGR